MSKKRDSVPQEDKRIITPEEFLLYFEDVIQGKVKHRNLILDFQRLVELEEQFAKNSTSLEMKEKLFKDLNVKFVQTLTQLYDNYHEEYYHFSGIFFALQLIQRPYLIVHFRDRLKNLKFETVKQLPITTDTGLVLNFIRYVYLVAGLRLTSHEEILKAMIGFIKRDFGVYNPTVLQLAALRDRIESWIPKQKIEFMNAVRICSTQYVKTVIGHCAEYFESPEHVVKHSTGRVTSDSSPQPTTETPPASEEKTTEKKTGNKITNISFVNYSRNANVCDVEPEELKAIRADIDCHAKIAFEMLEQWYQVYQNSAELKTMTYYEMLGFYIEMLYYGYGCEADLQKWATVVENSYKGPLNNDFNMLLTYMRSLNIMGYQSLANKALEEFVWRKKKYDSDLERETSVIQNNNAAHLYIQTTDDEKTKKFILAHKNDSDYMRYHYAKLLAVQEEYKKSCEIFVELANKVTNADYKDTLSPIPKAKVVAELCCNLITGRGCDKNIKLAEKMARTAYSKMEDPTGDLNIIMANLNEKNPEAFREYCIKAFSAGHDEAIELAAMYGYDDLVQEMENQTQD